MCFLKLCDNLEWEKWMGKMRCRVDGFHLPGLHKNTDIYYVNYPPVVGVFGVQVGYCTFLQLHFMTFSSADDAVLQRHNVTFWTVKNTSKIIDVLVASCWFGFQSGIFPTLKNRLFKTTTHIFQYYVTYSQIPRQTVPDTATSVFEKPMPWILQNIAIMSVHCLFFVLCIQYSKNAPNRNDNTAGDKSIARDRITRK